MATYDTAKFYWLQLKEDFFDEDAIDWLEEQPNGKEYSLFYLKLCLKSLRTNGILIRRVGEMLVPYDNKKLGELTKTNPDTVLVAMNLLIKIGLVKQLDGGELYLTQVEHMIGSQSKGAFKKQQQRIAAKPLPQIEGGQEGDNCPPKIEIDIEQDIEKDKDKEIKKEKDNSLTAKEVFDLYNSICISLPKALKLTPSREKSITARIRDGATLETFTTLFNKAESSNFLKGTNDRNWKADIDFLINPNSYAKTLEGKYDNKIKVVENKPNSFREVAENIRNMNQDTPDTEDYKDLPF